MVTNTNMPHYAKQGFTIVELLIVIVVIAILAAITIVAFNGIRARTIESSMQSDLKNNASILENDYTTGGAYPVNAAAANQGAGLKTSGDNVLAYTTKPYGYCATSTNTGSTKTFVVKSQTKQVAEGDCLVTTSLFSGAGTMGTANGPAGTAQFRRPEGLAFDAAGTMYVADTDNHMIRKVATDGTVSFLAGSGVAGFANNSGASAQFNYPMGIAVDSSGNVYVSDNTNHRIRKITPAGAVSTHAGSGTPGFANGNAATAQFNYPNGLTIDAAGNLYVADGTNHRIRKVTQNGDVTTIAGSGTNSFGNGIGTAAHISYPEDIDIATDGTLYVSDGTHRIRKITAGNVVTTLAGSGTYGYLDGNAATAQFAGPGGIAVNGQGWVYVMDIDNNRVRVVSPTGDVTTIAGSGNPNYTNGVGTAAEFNYPRDLILSANGDIYIADKWNNRIRKIVN